MGNGSKRGSIGVLIALHVLLGFYALSDVASKYAALSEPLSVTFLVCYCLVLVILFAYALGWQQIIKRMPLSSAYANRAVTIVWGIFWGAILFGETITIGKIIGAIVIIAGIALFAFADNPSTPPDEVNQEACLPSEMGSLDEHDEPEPENDNRALDVSAGDE